MVPKQCKLSLRTCHAILPFPFISNSHRYYQMPTPKSSGTFRCFSAERTHPIDDIKSSPLFVLFENEKKCQLYHKSAEIFDLNEVGAVHELSSLVPTMKQSLQPPDLFTIVCGHCQSSGLLDLMIALKQIETIPCLVLCPICLCPASENGGMGARVSDLNAIGTYRRLTAIQISEFDPWIFESNQKLWKKANSFSEASSVTHKELAAFCIWCMLCKNFITHATQAGHQCPCPLTGGLQGPQDKLEDMFASACYRLEGRLAHSLTQKEFKAFFLTCIGCSLIVTEQNHKYYCCYWIW